MSKKYLTIALGLLTIMFASYAQAIEQYLKPEQFLAEVFADNVPKPQVLWLTKEVVKEVPKEPMPITCPFCSRSYILVEHNYLCPSCGAATPKELIEESQLPKTDDKP